MHLYIGLMSGTSMDGIDVALVDVEENSLINGFTQPYSVSLHKRLQAISSGQPVPVSEFCQVNTLIGEAFASAVLELLSITKLSPALIKAIGSHGQTIAHNTQSNIPYTLQLGCGHTIAERTKIPVVADFRTRDLILGGQGAPFAPLYHQAVFANNFELPLAVVNIGGISNITILNKDKVQGWDVGPGNCLMDAWIKKHRGENYDKAGDWARHGKVITPLLERLKQDAFFKQSRPKSLGKEYCSLAWLEKHLSPENQPIDVQATLLALSAWCIAEMLTSDLKQLFICGGGAHNRALLEAIKMQLPGVKVQTTDAIGISVDYLEAMMFAWLASQTINHQPVDLRYITGSKKPALLGAIYPFVP